MNLIKERIINDNSMTITMKPSILEDGLPYIKNLSEKLGKLLKDKNSNIAYTKIYKLV